MNLLLFAANAELTIASNQTCHRFRSLINSEQLVWANAQDAFRLPLPPGKSLSSVDLSTIPNLAARVTSLSNLAKRRDIKPIRYSRLAEIGNPIPIDIRLVQGRLIVAEYPQKLVFYSLEGRIIGDIPHPHDNCGFNVEDVGNGKHLMLGTVMHSWRQELSIIKLYSLTLEYNSTNAVISMQHTLLAECTLDLFGFDSPSSQLYLRDKYIICDQKDMIAIVNPVESSAIRFSTSPADSLSGPPIGHQRYLNHIGFFNIHPTLPVVIIITDNDDLYALRIPECRASPTGWIPTHSLVNDGCTGTFRLPGQTASVTFGCYDGEWLLNVLYDPGPTESCRKMVSLRIRLESITTVGETPVARSAVFVELVPPRIPEILHPKRPWVRSYTISYRDTPSTLISHTHKMEYQILFSHGGQGNACVPRSGDARGNLISGGSGGD
ncbi:hypothetical protein SISNIDRAFT_490640 [Sistotremastrum niveocremeum HHB9708]|uniref:Uncharacterized protein n=2 Tax=Sistotremastraceae TaxID=3402574 RepID=A0A164NLU1_9AGAM|nr:hypothetical protein SISNIDRAFT_490640 [Sistotremastrum niveocremeum HHB9708]KZT31633.1 hypothetical protein SISSUDRAFT_1067599 [Sistotremastrum suecicum HHB10207 ss-3]